MRALILYTEIASYTRSCIDAFLEHEPGNGVLLFRYPVNAEAPFLFKDTKGLKEYDYSTHKAEMEAIVRDFSPDIILCSGWGNKDYLRIVSQYSGRIPTVLCFDNQWQGSLKQQLAGLYSRLFLKNKFSHAWVPGGRQYRFARVLGFKPEGIKTGFYAADTGFFNRLFEQNKGKKAEAFPKRLISVARYIPAKGLPLLWQAFIELKAEHSEIEWELWCFGQGQDFDEREEHPAIKHFGFVQPSDMPQYFAETGVFVLPSVYEPWGVAVHEMAAAGFPLVLSDRVGAASEFLKSGQNGFDFSSGSTEALKEALFEIFTMPDKALYQMGVLSHKIAQSVTPQLWAETLQHGFVSIHPQVTNNPIIQ